MYSHTLCRTNPSAGEWEPNMSACLTVTESKPHVHLGFLENVKTSELKVRLTPMIWFHRRETHFLYISCSGQTQLIWTIPATCATGKRHAAPFS